MRSCFARAKIVGEIVLRRGRSVVKTRLSKASLHEPLQTIPIAEAATEVIEVAPAEQVAMTRPERFTDNDWTVFQIRNISEIPALVKASFQGVAVTGDGFVFAGSAVVDGLWNEFGFPSATEARSFRSEPLRVCQGRTASLLVPWMPNYYHWTLQGIPRLKFYDDADWWLVPALGDPYVAEWLAIVGIPPERIIRVGADQHVFCESVSVVSIPAPNRWIPKWTVDWIRSTIVVEPRNIERLLVNRKPTEKRRIVNRREVDVVFGSYGFQGVDLTGRPLVEQASLFRGAKVVAGLLGAGLTNLVYCEPGAIALELIPKNHTFPAYRKLAMAAGLDHRPVLGAEPRVPMRLYRHDIDADTLVDIDLLRSELDRL